ncbi:MAG: ExbD/TolR family protein [Bacteroidota bacterium]
MGKFRKDDKKTVPGLSTASLPDIIFMLLFFFMVTTVIRETTVNVAQRLPSATEVTKLEKKNLVTHIYIGKPKPTYQDRYGSEPRIQLNDSFAKVEDIRDYIFTEREKLDEDDRSKMTTVLKIDKESEMGIVTDVKQALRKASALKVNYSAAETESVY